MNTINCLKNRILRCYLLLVITGLVCSMPAQQPQSESLELDTMPFVNTNLFGDRLLRPLPGSYKLPQKEVNPALAAFMEHLPERYPLIDTLLYDDTFGISTMDFLNHYYFTDIVLGKITPFAEITINLQNAVNQKQFLRITIPLGNWSESRKTPLERP